MDLFSQKMEENLSRDAPLADRLRPRDFLEFVGQEEIVGRGKMLRQLIDRDETPSLIFWGPPGVGKTTLARLIAEKTKSRFVALSAVSSGLDILRALIKEAVGQRQLYNKRTILFIDEIHRWNKAQQDALLPHVEKGVVTLIGATTENPSFEVVGALLSRCRVFVLKSLSEEDIRKLLERALSDKEYGFGQEKIKVEQAALDFLAAAAGGDARTALNGLEMAVKSLKHLNTETLKHKMGHIKIETVKEALQRTHLIFDKKGEEFYNLISALHKSMRGSDPDASLYWLARMLEGGADPLYVARRVLRFAAEDIGIADSRALLVANAAYDACHKIGLPECNVHLAEATVYCALAKKSNALYTAYGEAAADAKETSHLGVPLHLRNAPTKLMSARGGSAFGGKDTEKNKYKYPPDYNYEVKQDYLPKELKNKKYLKS